VNHGHVGFLAEAEADGLAELVDRVVARQYVVEERMTVDVTVRGNGAPIASAWALNEATVEKAARERMIELIIEIDGRPLSRWGCDGVVCSTPTGSTAYAFSAGGPVVWPEVEALLLVPISSHALFSRPLVVSPQSVLAVEVIVRAETSGAVLWCDGRRKVDLPLGARVEVRRGALPVLLARLPVPGGPFTDRLVAKFGLPVTGWRGRTWEDAGEHA
jgi:NAD+ kinase